MNFSMVIAINAPISKNPGIPLRFLCKPGAYYGLLELTDAGLLAKATERDHGANQAFNITNSHLFRLIASYFGFGAGAPLQNVPCALSWRAASEQNGREYRACSRKCIDHSINQKPALY
jgi:hypothetical protein